MAVAVDPLAGSMKTAFSGLQAQSVRLRVVSQNLANAQTTGDTAGENPYQRQTVSFKNALDRESGVNLVRPGKISVDRSPFEVRYEPGHPAADEAGFVKFPNVNALVELADMREANRGYEANLKVVTQVRSMIMETIGLLRSS